MEIYNGKYCVYIHTNKINNKKYVGQTCRDPIKRWGNDGSGYLKVNKKGKYQQPKFAFAIQKYG